MSVTSQYEFLILLLVAVLVLELVARRLRMPPAAAFISGGIALALVPGVPEFAIDPDLVLVIFLPPLIMNGAYFTVWQEFRDNLSGILLLALGAVAFTTLAVGVAVHMVVPALPWAVCFALGAIVSPPDAVAAEAVLERLTLPGSMNALLQGESLLNDASGLVLFRFAVAAALTGVFSAWGALGAFALVSVGGVAIGLALGTGGLFVIRRLRDSELTITATLLLAALSYVAADRLQCSGVLATVATGMILGWRQHTDFNATSRFRAQAFWKVLVFLLESLLFILIGLSLRGVVARASHLQDASRQFVAPVVVVVAVVILSRFVWMFASALVSRALRRLGVGGSTPPAWPVVAVMSWAGMRGVVTLAAALSLPQGVPGRDLVLLCAFAVILVTVLVQGTTLGPIIEALQLTGPEERRRQQASEDDAWMRMNQAQFEAVASRSRQDDGSQRHPRLLEQYGHRARVATEYTEDRDRHQPQKIEHFAVVLAAIAAGRAEALRMHRAGEIHDRVLRGLEQELDLQQMVAESHSK